MIRPMEGIFFNLNENLKSWTTNLKVRTKLNHITSYCRSHDNLIIFNTLPCQQHKAYTYALVFFGSFGYAKASLYNPHWLIWLCQNEPVWSWFVVGVVGVVVCVCGQFSFSQNWLLLQVSLHRIFIFGTYLH